MASSTRSTYTFDRKLKRWRKNGKWSKPPKPSELAKNAKGQIVDSTGKALPKAALPVSVRARPKKASPAVKTTKKKKGEKPKSGPKRAKVQKTAAKKKKTKKVKKTKPRRKASGLGPVPKPRPRGAQVLRGFPSRGRPLYVAEGMQITPHQVVSSRYENVREPSLMAEILYNTMSRKAEKLTIPATDLVFYEYGLELVCTTIPRSLEATKDFVNQLSKEYPDFDFKWNEQSIHVSLGNRDRPSSLNQVRTTLKRNTDTFLDIYQYAADFWDGDIGWFVYAENDDLEAGS